MSFANHNILDIALSIIPPTVVQIRKTVKTEDNDYGQVTASYTEWVDVYGIVEPGSESNEHVHGIDFSKKRVSIWLRGVDLTGTHIQEAPDQIRYVGRIYNVVDVDDWFAYDNYRKCDCVEATNLAPEQKVTANKTEKPIASGSSTTPSAPASAPEPYKPNTIFCPPTETSAEEAGEPPKQETTTQTAPTKPKIRF